MSTPSTPRTVYVGLLVAGALAILGGTILTIGDLNDTFTKKITAKTVFPEVNGLQQGDNIWFSGVKVGIVRGLAFEGASQVMVELRIDREATRFIHADAQVKIGSDGLIGNRIVVIYGGTEAAPNLADGDMLVVGDSVSTDDIMATLQENNNNLLAITTDLKGITGTLSRGEGTVGKLIADDALYTELKSTVTTLGQASDNARTLTASLSTFSGKLNRPGSLPNDLVTDQTTYKSLTATVAGLQHTGAQADALVEGIAKGAADPQTPAGALLHDASAGADLKSSLANLNRSSALLRDDLAALQHSFPLKGWFRRQERAKARAAADADATPPAP